MTTNLKTLSREARQATTSPARLLELAAMAPQLSRTVARLPQAAGPVLETLARSGDLTTRKLVAAHPAAPPALLETLGTDRQWTVLKAVAENPHTPARTLDALAGHARHTVRLAALHNPHIRPAVVETLSHDHDLTVRVAALFHPALPGSVKRHALTDPLPEVRAAALGSLGHLLPDAGGLTDADLQQAATDPEDQVRHAAAILLDRDDLPFYRFMPAGRAEQLANELLNSADSFVACAAARRATADRLPARLLPLLQEPGYDAALILIERTDDPHVTAAILALNDPWLTHHLARHTRDATSYAQLLRDPEARDHLPGNPHIPEAFWIQVGQATLADTATVRAHLPLLKRALTEQRRPALLVWFGEHLPALLRHVPEFAGEVFDWRSFSVPDLRRVAFSYLHAADTQRTAETILTTLDQGTHP